MRSEGVKVIGNLIELALALNLRGTPIKSIRASAGAKTGSLVAERSKFGLSFRCILWQLTPYTH